MLGRDQDVPILSCTFEVCHTVQPFLSSRPPIEGGCYPEIQGEYGPCAMQVRQKSMISLSIVDPTEHACQILPEISF